MKSLLFLFLVASGFAFAKDKTLQILTPQKMGANTTVVPILYQVQHPLLRCDSLRAHPFPGLRQLIVDEKVSKVLYTTNTGELFELIELPLSKTETKKGLQAIKFGGSEGVQGECLPFSEKAQNELTAYLASKYEEELSEAGISKTIYLLQKKNAPGFNRARACAFLKGNQKNILEQKIVSLSELSLLLKTNCPLGSG